MEEFIVYVRVDAHDRIVEAQSSAFLRDPTGWTEIDRGSGFQYYHAQGHYFPQSIIAEDGVYRYKLVDGAAVERTAEEMEADRAAAQLTAQAAEVRAQRDRLLAETDWTQVLDAPVSDESRAALRVYRQTLRDVTTQEGFPAVVVWPELPEIVSAAPDPVDEAVDVLLGGVE